ncbi:glutamate 5-kinase [candidate division KSB1 bacterium]|nr:glutamate 5-kinase [candidate division KSB1 bacterium]
MQKPRGVRIEEWKRAVLKVGSALITSEGVGCSTKHLLAIASFITESRSKGKDIIVVSSGAVSAGLSTQPKMMRKIYRSIPEKQALAAIGQPLLMASWNRFFDFPCAQLLLTYDDILNRTRFVNAKNTLLELLKLRTLPIINENDTVAVDELKVGDNDNLAAHVAVLAEADLLIICTDIDGLYDADPHLNSDASLISEVKTIDNHVYSLAGGTQNPLSTGGMRTKIAAAEKATSKGIDTIILNGSRHEYLDQLQNGSVHGTLFRRTQNPIASKKHWMLHVLPNQGQIFVDAGAARALRTNKASLLPSGVLDVSGDFSQGDAVQVFYRSSDSTEKIAKGIAQYGSDDIKKIRGKQSYEIDKILGYISTNAVIQRDDMVLLQ